MPLKVSDQFHSQGEGTVRQLGLTSFFLVVRRAVSIQRETRARRKVFSGTLEKEEKEEIMGKPARSRVRRQNQEDI